MTYKKYRNRKIYNTKKSCYATVGEVFQASLKEGVRVVDAVTGADLTTETILSGAIESLSKGALDALAAHAVNIGNEFGVVEKPKKTAVTEELTSPETVLESNDKDLSDDLFAEEGL